MTIYPSDVAETLRAFVADLQRQTQEATFMDSLARRYWESMKEFAEANLLSLQETLASVDLTTPEQRELLLDTIELSQETLAWTEENELAYADALAESGKVFLDRLRYSGLLSSKGTRRAAWAGSTIIGAGERIPQFLPHTWVNSHPPHVQGLVGQRAIAPPIREVEWSEIEYEMWQQTRTPDTLRGFIMSL